MLHLLLAAALSAAPAKPLFVPPRGMTRVTEDAWARREIRGNAAFVAEYRGMIAMKPSWSRFTYNVPETITIAMHPTSANADEWGIRTFTGIGSEHPSPAAVAFCARRAHCVVHVPTTKKLTAQAVALCGGKRGWLNAFQRDDETYEQLFARSGNRMYVAVLRYPTAAGDGLHAARALTTLCPQNAGDFPAPATAVPLLEPAGWTRSASDLHDADTQSAPYTITAYWFHLAPSSMIAQYLTLAQASDASEYITPQQEAAQQIDVAKAAEKGFVLQANRAAKLCNGGDAWFSQFSATDKRGNRYTAETMYAYGNDTSYVLRYVRDAREPEDPAARKALYSLCPPQASTQ